MADIKDRAREYLAEHSEYSEVFGQTFVAVDTLTAMVDFAEPREKQIQIDAEQIRALQKQNGELTDELKTLRESVKDYGAKCYENGLRNGRRKLEAQIEKMKCCENCAKRGHICVAEEMQGNLCGKNKDKWELRR